MTSVESKFWTRLICSEGRRGCRREKHTTTSFVCVRSAPGWFLCVLGGPMSNQTPRVDGRERRRDVYPGGEKRPIEGVNSDWRVSVSAWASPLSVWVCGWRTFVLPPSLLIIAKEATVKQMTSLEKGGATEVCGACKRQEGANNEILICRLLCHLNRRWGYKNGSTYIRIIKEHYFTVVLLLWFHPCLRFTSGDFSWHPLCRGTYIKI